jgi:hypothetical protein
MMEGSQHHPESKTLGEPPARSAETRQEEGVNTEKRA